MAQTMLIVKQGRKGEMPMKIAVSAVGKELDAQIDPRFGRCAFFLIIDLESMAFEAYDNGNIALGGGAGIQSAQFVASKGAQAVITGNCGPNAVQTLRAAGIAVILGQSGTVKDAVEAFRQGMLSSTTEPNVSDHHGFGDASSSAAAAGRGMGRGGGRCRQSFVGSGPGAQTGRKFDRPPASASMPPAGEIGEATLDGLKSRVEDLRREIETLEARIKPRGTE